MNDNVRAYTPEVRKALRTFQGFAAAGGLYSGWLLLGSSGSAISDDRLMLYTLWFIVAIVSIEAILRFIRAGIYALAIITLAVTMLDWAAGAMTIGGASLAVLLVVFFITYVKPFWQHLE